MDEAAYRMSVVPLLMAARLLPFGLLLPRVFATSAPRRWGIGIALLLALSLAMIHGGELSPADAMVFRDGHAFARALARELLLGLALAGGFSVLLASLFVAGSLLSQISGMNLPDVTDPMQGTMGDSALQRYFTWLALAVFLTSGGHRQLIESLGESFVAIPPGSPLPALAASELTGELLTQCFFAGIRIAAPVAFCLLFSTAIVALLARGMPSLGAFGTGIGVNLVVLLLTTCLSLEAIVASYQQSWTAGVETIVDAWHEGIFGSHE